MKYINSTVFFWAVDSEQKKEDMIEDYLMANIGASDFARHISVSKASKGEHVKQLFKSLLKRPLVTIEASCFETSKSLKFNMVDALMKMHAKTDAERIKMLE